MSSFQGGKVHSFQYILKEVHDLKKKKKLRTKLKTSALPQSINRISRIASCMWWLNKNGPHMAGQWGCVPLIFGIWTCTKSTYFCLIVFLLDKEKIFI